MSRSNTANLQNLKDLKMAILAEPRRKQKWSVDPRNSAWSNDDSKFGQKMLERMGWSKGKGLGKSEQGATEHIKVKVKNNSLGLGTNVCHEDNWIAHQDDFNQLLADLNNCHGQNSMQESTQEEKQENFSLEQKSKSSRKRVHYMKFTKGKDLSSRSETDLACIFGKRSKPSKDQDEESSGQDSHEELVRESQAEAAEVETVTSNKQEELNTVTSTLTMQEYFAQRMAQLKKARQGTAAAHVSSQSLTNGTNGLIYTPTPMTSASDTPMDSPNISDTEQQTEKKKKKKKKKRENDEEKAVDVDETADCVPDVTAIAADEKMASQEQSSSSERKKKKKKQQRTEEVEEEKEMVVEECVTPVPVQEDSEISNNVSAERKKRKKKKTHRQEALSEAVEADQGDSQASGESKAEDTDSRSKKKKRKRGVKEEQQQQEEGEEAAVVEQKKSKKDKKKNKKDHD